MKIGILQCDSVRSTLSAKYGEYADMIKEAVLRIDDDATFEIYQAYKKELPTAIDECDAYIITGSRDSVFEDFPWIDNLLQFVISLNKEKVKVLGFCFGHQIIAKALGGKVERDDVGWNIGLKKFEVKEQLKVIVDEALESKINKEEKDTDKAKNLFGKNKSFEIIMMSKDKVKELPEKAEVLAFGTTCKYGVLQYENHFLTAQGHPEFSKEFAKALLVVCKKDIPAKRYEKGMATFLEKNTNNDTDDTVGVDIFKLFYNFLKR